MFVDTGITRILEAVDFDDIDEVSPLFGAILDGGSGQVDEAPFKKLLTKYADLIDIVLCRHMRQGWKGTELENLLKQVKSLNI